VWGESGIVGLGGRVVWGWGSSFDEQGCLLGGDFVGEVEGDESSEGVGESRGEVPRAWANSARSMAMVVSLWGARRRVEPMPGIRWAFLLRAGSSGCRRIRGRECSTLA
jgi:hypothetical protein